MGDWLIQIFFTQESILGTVVIVHAICEGLYLIYIQNTVKVDFFTETSCKLIQKQTCLLKVMAWYMKNVEPNLKVVNENPILFVQDEKYKIFYYFNDGKG